jgi:hypothetical protein
VKFLAAYLTTSAFDDAVLDIDTEFQSIMQKFCDTTGSGTTKSQGDAMEFATFLLDSLHEELHRNPSIARAPVASPAVGSSQQQANAADEWELVKKPKSSATAWTLPTTKAAGGDKKTAGVQEPQSAVVVKKVVVDNSSKDAAARSINSSLVGRIFHGILRCVCEKTNFHSMALTMACVCVQIRSFV